MAIETSCDETSVAVVKDGTKLVAHSLSTSADIHEKYGGVVPEVAARKQAEFILPVIRSCVDKAIKELNLDSKEDLFNKIDSIAVTVGPGLAGSLVVGLNAAKALCFAYNKPLIPVNHLIGHIYGNFVNNPNFFKIKFPALVLIVSGGHTDLILMKSHSNIMFLGSTLDDAAGEAFDKVARLLKISNYLGGAKLSKIASTCTHDLLKNKFPRPKIKDNDYDFSFSGLKTAVKRYVEKNEDYNLCCVCKDFEDSVVEVLCAKTLKAYEEYKPKSVLLGGGVSANSNLRSKFKELFKEQLFVPPLELCTDNAVYIASAAHFNGKRHFDYRKVSINPGLAIDSELDF